MILGNDENEHVPFGVHHMKVRKVLDERSEETEDNLLESVLAGDISKN